MVNLTLLSFRLSSSIHCACFSRVRVFTSRYFIFILHPWVLKPYNQFHEFRHKTHASETCLNFTGSHSPEFRFMCSIVSFYGIIYNSTFEKPSAPLPTPSIRFAFVVLPLSIFSFFLLSARDPISQSIHSRRSYELQITASRFMRSLIV